MIDGSVIVAGEARQRTNNFRAIAARTGEEMGPAISEAEFADVEDACAAAALAAPVLARISPVKRADFLAAIAREIASIGDTLIETAMEETGLPRARLEGERQRTIDQLGMFADEVRLGDWLDATVDRALPDRVPPRPDLRRMNVPIGPVAVFGASNFPLAFSVAGGDTASAFAAGCPVVVKGHPAHPATGEFVARAIALAVGTEGLPSGTFSFLPGRSNDVGRALVEDPRIAAVGFTGSRAAGLALTALAQDRPIPIPVYAEMSSVNPVILMPGALRAGGSALGTAFAGSLTLGEGQFCTNPGLVIAIDAPEFDDFLAAATSALATSAAGPMLTPAIAGNYAHGVARLAKSPDVERLAGDTEAGTVASRAALFMTSGADFLASHSLQEEVFGPSSLAVRCRDIAQMTAVIEALEGQLTATLHLEPEDEAAAVSFVDRLINKAGRILVNGWPTGVEVCAAMVHGGPYPSTTDSRTTSVGTLAMTRFLRPVCFQGLPQSLLPKALRAGNPLRISIKET